MRRLSTLLLALILASTNLSGQESAGETKNVSFRFVAGDDMFYIPWAGNGAELERLYALLDEYGAQIASGHMPVYVDSYCASLPARGENLRMAFIRANRVKSDLILHKGLKEEDFITANHAEAYRKNRNVVVVTLRIPAPAPEKPQPQPAPAEPVATPQPIPEPQPAPEPVAEQPQPEPVAEQPAPAAAKPYCLAVRTNVLYDAFLLPTLGIEWRVSPSLGIKLDGSLAWWGSKTGKVQKMWVLNPEVRWYMLRSRRFYAGVSGNFGQANIYKYPLGGLLSSDTGYQGDFWGAGLTVGYQLYLSRCFSVDFNLGLGCTRFDYDTFRMIDGVRVFKDRDCTKNFWGPTQAGVNLIWTIGGKK